MTENDYKIALKVAFEASSILEASVMEARGRLSESDHRVYRIAVGTVLTAIGEEMIEPMFAQYPELRPKDNEEWGRLRDEVALLPD